MYKLEKEIEELERLILLENEKERFDENEFLKEDMEEKLKEGIKKMKEKLREVVREEELEEREESEERKRKLKEIFDLQSKLEIAEKNYQSSMEPRPNYKLKLTPEEIRDRAK